VRRVRCQEGRSPGQSSPRAALICLHATRERDEKVAAGMGKLFADAMKTSKTGTDPKPSRTQRARRTKRILKGPAADVLPDDCRRGLEAC
jgi:hypothetical protein